MNFVTNFSINRNWNKVEYDLILMMIDWLTKMMHYISIIKIINAENLTKVFIKKIVQLHDFLFFIIINKKLLFILSFWLMFCYIIKIKKKFFIAFYF